MRLVVAINDRCRSVIAPDDRSYDQSWRPIVRSIVTVGDRWLGATINRTINRSIVRPIVATYDRSYDQLWHQTTDRTIHRSIVRPIVRSIVRLPIRDHPQLAVGVTMHDWWYDHVRPICDRLRFGIAGYKF